MIDKFMNFTLLIFICQGVSCILGDYSVLLEHVKSFSKINFVDDCTTIISSRNVSKLFENGQGFQSVNLDVHNIKDLTKTQKMLKLQCTCALAAYVGDSTSQLLNIMSLIKSVESSVVLYISSQEPNLVALLKSNKPVIWANEGKVQGTIQLHVYCPKMGRPKTMDRTLLGICNQHSCSLPRVADTCKNPFKGQTMINADVHQPPHALRPSVFGVKKMSGCGINTFFFLSQYFHFKSKISFVNGGVYVPHNNTFTPGRFAGVLSGNTDIFMTGMIELYNNFFDFYGPLGPSHVGYITKAPARVDATLSNITRPFSSEVWVMTICCVAMISCSIFITYKTYDTVPMMHFKLTTAEKSSINFLLYPFAKITEPECLPWFKKWSTGKFLIFLWMFLSSFLIWSYHSNLRANLITIDYEKPPDTLNDIADSGRKIYMHDTAVRQRKNYLSATGQRHSAKYKIAEVAEASEGLYKTLDGLPKNAPKDLLDNGAFIFTDTLLLPYQIVRHPLLKRRNLHIVEEKAGYFYSTHLVKKYSPGTREVQRIVRRVVDYGLQNKWLTQHLPLQATVEPRPAQLGLQSLQLAHLYSTFWFIMAGHSFALLAMLFELVVTNFVLPYKRSVEVVVLHK